MLQIKRLITVVVLVIIGTAGATVLPDTIRVQQLIANAPIQNTDVETRGYELSPQSSLLVQRRLTDSEFRDLERRVAAIESERTNSEQTVHSLELRMAVVQSEMGTIFELGRVVFGAAIVYLVQMVIGAAVWVNRRKQT